MPKVIYGVLVVLICIINRNMRVIQLKCKTSKTRQVFFLTVLLALFSNAVIYGSDKPKGKQAKNAPLFSGFVYQGNDKVYNENPLKPDEFYNPILQGCYPDPAITRKGDDYYLVCSSFAIFPGVPIFHSKDLVNWKQIGHVLDRTSQLKVEDCGISAGVYAPAIKYNKHNDMFYMITTQFSGGFGNIVVKTQDPAKGWSDPIKLKFEGIDPSMFFDDNGKTYVVHNDAPDAGKELYIGHRVIKIWEYDMEQDQVIAGTDKIIVDGGVDLSKKPIWIEAPHIYKKNGRYYLMCAEGGTGGWHSEVIFVSDSPKGPYVPAPSNPILTQRYLNANRSPKIDWAGHADLVEGPDGKHYGVFLAIRPNEVGRVNIGRETFILPVDWSGDFPVFENGLVPMQPKLKLPKGVVNKAGQDGFFPNGNFTFTDNFISSNLDYRWVGIRGPRENFVSFAKTGLKINPFPVNIKEVKPTSTLFYRQQHSIFSASTTLSYIPQSETDLAGLVCYQSEQFNYVFGVTKKGNQYYLLLQRTEKGLSTILASVEIDVKKPIQLKVNGGGDNYEFSYSLNGTDFVNVGGIVSGDILSTNVAGGFTGSLIGLYATTLNDAKP
jgi:xylan 1,4-beta-xylosidase